LHICIVDSFIAIFQPRSFLQYISNNYSILSSIITQIVSGFGGMRERNNSNMPSNFLDINSYSSEYAYPLFLLSINSALVIFLPLVITL
jgi:hypothetical protein